MLKTTLAALLAAATLTLSACGSMAPKPATAAPAASMNGLLAARTGMTLYSFDKDTAGSGKSTCNGPCAMLWPPLLAQATDSAGGDYTIITRDDGSRQWAWKGWPLYTYSKDAKAGDATGDNFKNVWHVIKG